MPDPSAATWGTARVIPFVWGQYAVHCSTEQSGKPSGKKSVSVWFFSKGPGGVMTESKLFEELFGSVYVWTLFRKREGELPNSKLFEELFCLSLDIYQEEGGYLIPKKFRNFSACAWTFFRRGGAHSPMWKVS